MALIESKLTFGKELDVALNIGNELKGDVLDLGTGVDYAKWQNAVTPDIGKGFGPNMLYWVMVATTSFAGTGAVTKFDLLNDTTADLATAPTTILTTGDLALTDAEAGDVLVNKPLPYGTFVRYLGMWETVATANLTAGEVYSWLQIGPFDPQLVQ